MNTGNPTPSEGGRLSRRDALKLAGLFTLGAAFQQLAHIRLPLAQATSARPNFLILVLDTLSARHMSLYGYPRQTTPSIARLAESAMVYHNHHAAGSFTTPGTASLLTGTYPWSHRALQPSSMAREDFTSRSLFNLISPEYFSLAYTHNPLAMYLLHQFHRGIGELMPFGALTLKEMTAAGSWLWNDFPMADTAENVITGIGQPPSSLFLSAMEPLGQRQPALRAEYRDLFPKGLPGGESRSFTLEACTDWLSHNLATLPSPHLAYFHLLPPHEPYLPRKEFIGTFPADLNLPAKPPHPASEHATDEALGNLRREYDEFIAYSDAEFGRLYDNLLRSGQLDNTWLILTSDHGQLFERGIHGHLTPAMYQPLLHIPLVIRPPGGRQRLDIHDLTSNVDLLPTLLTLLNEPLPAWLEGQVLPGFTGIPDPERVVYALDAKESSVHGPLRSGTAVMRQGSYKLIHTFGYKELADEDELYDVEADPEELDNLYEALPDVAAGMRAKLEESVKRNS